MSQEQDPKDEGGPSSVGDDQLPEDLRPADDNPLARAAGDDVPDDVIARGAEGSDSDSDSEGASKSGGGDDASASSREASSEDRED
jgi:hypothetical protein